MFDSFWPPSTCACCVFRSTSFWFPAFLSSLQFSVEILWILSIIFRPLFLFATDQEWLVVFFTPIGLKTRLVRKLKSTTLVLLFDQTSDLFEKSIWRPPPLLLSSASRLHPKKRFYEQMRKLFLVGRKKVCAGEGLHLTNLIMSFFAPCSQVYWPCVTEGWSRRRGFSDDAVNWCSSLNQISSVLFFRKCNWLFLWALSVHSFRLACFRLL